MNSNKNLFRLPAALAGLLGVWVCVLLAGAPVAARADDVAGKIISANGSVRIARQGQEFDAARGAELRAGDVLKVAALSNAQVLFADDATMALRADTVFRVDEFSYQRNAPAAAQKAFFSLLKGGLRTITGWVGKRSHDDYRVSTPTSTVGVRGTDFLLVQCEGGCRNADGSVAPPGTYGQVSEGHIAVRNDSGEHLFGTNEYFHVPDSHSAPEKLIAPPHFLSDTLAGRHASNTPVSSTPGGGSSGSSSSGGSSSSSSSSSSGTIGTSGGSSGSSDPSTVANVLALTGSGASTGDTGVTAGSLGASVPALPDAPVPTTFQSTSNVLTAGASSLIQPAGSSAVLYFNLQGAQVAGMSCANPPCGTVSISQIVMTVNLAAQRAYVTSIFTDQSGGVFNLGTPLNSGGMPVTVTGSTVSFGGTFNLASYPTQNGSFRCSTCGAGGAVGALDTITMNGTITATQASMTLTGSNAYSSGGFSVNLPAATPTSLLGAAAIIPRSGGGSNAVGWTTWNVQVDTSGALIGLGNTTGNNNAQLGGASNTTVGTDAATGMVWGYWHGAGATVVDTNYVSLTTGAAGRIPWIVGPFTASPPASLGTSVSFSPVGSVVNGTTGTLGSASLTADFVNRNVAINIVSSSTGVGASTYTMQGSSGFSATTGRFSAGFSSGSCTGTCNAASPSAVLGGSFSGNFIGPLAQAAGLAYTYGYGLSNGVNGVIALKR